jgi:hypothetical protein
MVFLSGFLLNITFLTPGRRGAKKNTFLLAALRLGVEFLMSLRSHRPDVFQENDKL